MGARSVWDSIRIACMHKLCMAWGCASLCPRGLVRPRQMGPARKPIMDEFAQRTAGQSPSDTPCALSESTQAACAAPDFEQTCSAAVCSAVSVLLDVRGH